MKKTILFAFVSLFSLVLLFSFALAVNENNSSENRVVSGIADTEIITGEDSGNNSVNNLTYGSCVSAAAKVKNTCYSSLKETRNSCRANAANNTANRAGVAKCSVDYRKDMKQCKVDFKATKKNECAQIKHNFLETVGSSLK